MFFKTRSPDTIRIIDLAAEIQPPCSFQHQHVVSNSVIFYFAGNTDENIPYGNVYAVVVAYTKLTQLENHALSLLSFHNFLYFDFLA